VKRFKVKSSHFGVTCNRLLRAPLQPSLHSLHLTCESGIVTGKRTITRATFITPPTKAADTSSHISEMRILNSPHLKGNDSQLIYRSCRYHLISPPQPLRHPTYFFKSNKGHAAK
jgi:hypothetical protein